MDERDVGERTGRHVLRHLGVAHLDHVGRVAARECRVELLQVVAPVLVLDVDRRAGVILLELRVGGSDDVRPAGLCVDLEPYGELVGLLRADACARRRRDDSERDGRNSAATKTRVLIHVSSSRRRATSALSCRCGVRDARDGRCAELVFTSWPRRGYRTPDHLCQDCHRTRAISRSGVGRLSSVTIRYRSPR